MKEHLELILGLKKLKEEVKENMKSEGETEKECRAGDGAPIYRGTEEVQERSDTATPHRTALPTEQEDSREQKPDQLTTASALSLK